MGRRPRKPLKSSLQKGQTVSFYLDPHFEEEPLGKGVLLSIHKEASHSEAFILQEMPVQHQEVWSIAEWCLSVTEVTRKGESFHFKPKMELIRPIKVLFSVGVTPSGKTSQRELAGFYEERLPKFLHDNFEIVPGWGQCF